MKKILAIGDLHLREHMPYADYISDGRVAEKREILNFITEQGKDCDTIVFLGDQFHHKNNPSEVVREFVEFVESFGDKQIYILAGNHEKHGNGKSAIDFMGEVKKPNWHIITDGIVWGPDGMVFCPYFHRPEMGLKSLKGATAKLTKALGTGKILFTHHAISDMDFGEVNTNILQEIVLPKEELENNFELIVAGHVHMPQEKKTVIMTGNIFNDEMGQKERLIWKITPKTNKTERILLPGRPIIKLEDPTDLHLGKIPPNAIVKVILTKKRTRNEILKLREHLSKLCDANIIVEKIKNTEREQAKFDTVMDLSVEDLLKIYAKEKSIPTEKLLAGYNLIK